MSRIAQRGVTLIELMVVVAIVAILAAIAYPGYQSQVRQSRRAAAQAFLMEAAGRQHQRMLDVRSYAANLADLITPPTDVSEFYNVSVADVSVAAFTLRAAATGAQVDDSGCATLDLTNTGAKSPADCW